MENTDKNKDSIKSNIGEKKGQIHQKPIISGIIIALIIIIISSIWFANAIKRPYLPLYTVENGVVTKQIMTIGNVKAAQDVDLSFQSSGQIKYVAAQAGDNVNEGEVLASIDDSSVEAELEQAQANVSAAQAKLAELQNGTRPEQIQIQNSAVSGAETALKNALSTLQSQIQSSYIATDDAIHDKSDIFFNNPRSNNPSLTLVLSDSSLTNKLQSERLALENTMKQWSISINALSASSTTSNNLINYDSQAENALNQAKTFLVDLAFAVNSLTPSSNTPQSTIDSYKASLEGAQSEVAGSITAEQGALTTYNSDQSALTLAQNQLSLDQAGSQTEEIQAQQAAVDQAQAVVQNLNVTLTNTSIRAPFSGKLTIQNAKVGQISSPGIPVMSMSSDSQFQIETYVPENALSDIKIDDPAKVTLDAYGPTVIFDAEVINIDPAETIINGVASYKVTLQFDKNDDRIKSGLTANIEIDSSIAANTLVVPAQSIITEDNINYVMLDIDSNLDHEIEITSTDGNTGSNQSVKTSNQIKLQEIQIGDQGTDGMVEVLSGLSSEERIASFN